MFKAVLPAVSMQASVLPQPPLLGRWKGDVNSSIRQEALLIHRQRSMIGPRPPHTPRTPFMPPDEVLESTPSANFGAHSACNELSLVCRDSMQVPHSKVGLHNSETILLCNRCACNWKINSQRILLCNWCLQKVPHGGAQITQKNSCQKALCNRCPV